MQYINKEREKEEREAVERVSIPKPMFAVADAEVD